VGVHFQIPLAKFAPGPYTCQVNVMDEVGKKLPSVARPWYCYRNRVCRRRLGCHFEVLA